MQEEREMTPVEKEEQKLRIMLEVEGAEAVIQYLKNQVKERDAEIKKGKSFREAKQVKPSDTVLSRPETTQQEDSGPDSK